MHLRYTYVTPSSDGIGMLRESWERADIRYVPWTSLTAS